MILKYKVNGTYIYRDHIENFSIDRKDNSVQPKEIHVSYMRKDTHTILRLTDEAYLMNDDGKTIERII
jgi:hypothetical protein